MGALPELIWGYLIHLSYNMWLDCDSPDPEREYIGYRPYLRFDEDLFHQLLEQMAEAGVNMLVIDLGDAVRYQSHPEIAVEGAWSSAKLREELARVRELGIEPIPKLNFSTAHDAWLGPYSRCVSTKEYYDVCRDLIAEVCELFDGPRLFHLGMDEETFEHQKYYLYALVRQYDLWWDDLFFYVAEVERHGARGWVWSDYLWHHPERFWAKMPTSVLQSNWYYYGEFDPENVRVRAYDELDAHGYDQIPTGSNYVLPENLPRTVQYAKEHIAPERLWGFLQTVWQPTLPPFRERHEEAIRAIKDARRAYEA
ncbi:MAG: Tat pathway signal protein [Anaerolineae bacterium]|nr:Tat pathway signal protein [Anaerolineae bacterium]